MLDEIFTFERCGNLYGCVLRAAYRRPQGLLSIAPPVFFAFHS